MARLKLGDVEGSVLSTPMGMLTSDGAELGGAKADTLRCAAVAVSPLGAEGGTADLALTTAAL